MNKFAHKPSDHLKSFTAFLSISILTSAVFVACAKPSNDKAKTPVRTAKPSETGTPSPTTAKTSETLNKILGTKLTREQLKNTNFQIQDLTTSQPFRGNFQLDLNTDPQNFDFSNIQIQCLTDIHDMTESHHKDGLILFGNSHISLKNSPAAETTEQSPLYTILNCNTENIHPESNSQTKTLQNLEKIQLTTNKEKSSLELTIFINNEKNNPKIITTKVTCSTEIDNMALNKSEGNAINMSSGSILLVIQGSQSSTTSEAGANANETSAEAKVKAIPTVIECK